MHLDYDLAAERIAFVNSTNSFQSLLCGQAPLHLIGEAAACDGESLRGGIDGGPCLRSGPRRSGQPLASFRQPCARIAQGGIELVRRPGRGT